MRSRAYEYLKCWFWLDLLVNASLEYFNPYFSFLQLERIWRISRGVDSFKVIIQKVRCCNNLLDSFLHEFR